MVITEEEDVFIASRTETQVDVIDLEEGVWMPCKVGPKELRTLLPPVVERQ